MKKYQNNNKMILVVAIIFFLIMVVFPQVTAVGSKAAIYLWLNSILPILLPFFIFADFIKRSGNMEKISTKYFPLIMAILSGYPMGAKITGDLVNHKTLTIEEGKAVLSYSFVTGPAFILGTVGSFLVSQEGAWIVLISHYLGAFCNGCFYKNHGVKGRSNFPNQITKKEINSFSVLDNFTKSIVSGFQSIAIILAYLIFFMIGIEFFEMIGIFQFLRSETMVAVLKGMLEMTIGLNTVGFCNISLDMKVILSAFLISFGGLSVIGQSVSMIGDIGIKPTEVLLIKLTHGLLAGIIALILVQFML